MSYVYLFVNAIVVALMAMYVYVYEKERGIGDTADNHDTSRSTEDIKATTAVLVVALMVLYVYVNERRMRKISTELDHYRTDFGTEIKIVKDKLKLTKNEITRQVEVDLKPIRNALDPTIERINLLSKEMTEKDNVNREITDKIRGNVNAFCEELDKIKKVDSACACGKPAFFAALTPHFTLTGIDAVLKFDNVKVNRGGAYDPSTGVFTATVQGLYHFSCMILATHGAAVHYQLNKNDQPYILGYSHKVLDADSSTISAVVELTVGDTVFVKHRAAAAQVVYGEAHTSFSGYFIHE